MREIWSYLQIAFAVIGSWLGWFFGGYDGFIYALITFVVIDYITVSIIGLPIPEKLKDAMAQLNGKEEGDKPNESNQTKTR